VTLVAALRADHDTARRRPIEGGGRLPVASRSPVLRDPAQPDFWAPGGQHEASLSGGGIRGNTELMIELRARYFGDWLRGGRR